MYGSCHNPSSEDVTEFHLRRLETNSKKLMDGDWFDAQWMWYKLDNSHQWIKYEVNEVSCEVVLYSSSSGLIMLNSTNTE